MRRLAVLAMAALLPAIGVHAENKQIKAVLVGTQEVPAISTDGRGSFRARISNDGNSIHYERITGVITAADVIGPGAQGVAAGELDELIEALRDGVAYANVHSTLWPGGEIRSQLGHDHDHDD
jgi:hypothetical protein